MARSIRDRKGRTFRYSADPGSQWYRSKRKRPKKRHHGSIAQAKAKIPAKHKRHLSKLLYRNTDIEGTIYVFRCTCGKRFTVWIDKPESGTGNV